MSKIVGDSEARLSKVIKDYFNEGRWGNKMEGIPRERGVWMSPHIASKEVPKRLI